MTRKLVTGVRVVDPDGVTVVVGPGEAPAWAVEQITNDAAWEDDGEDEVLVLPVDEPAAGRASEDEPSPESEGESGAEVDVPVLPSDEPASGRDDTDTDPQVEAEAVGYESMTVAELKAEIGDRNSVRETADRIPTDGVKADLIAALEADDEQQ